MLFFFWKVKPNNISNASEENSKECTKSSGEIKLENDEIITFTYDIDPETKQPVKVSYCILFT